MAHHTALTTIDMSVFPSSFFFLRWPCSQRWLPLPLGRDVAALWEMWGHQALSVGCLSLLTLRSFLHPSWIQHLFPRHRGAKSWGKRVSRPHVLPLLSPPRWRGQSSGLRREHWRPSHRCWSSALVPRQVVFGNRGMTKMDPSFPPHPLPLCLPFPLHSPSVPSPRCPLLSLLQPFNSSQQRPRNQADCGHSGVRDRKDLHLQKPHPTGTACAGGISVTMSHVEGCLEGGRLWSPFKS